MAIDFPTAVFRYEASGNNITTVPLTLACRFTADANNSNCFMVSVGSAGDGWTMSRTSDGTLRAYTYDDGTSSNAASTGTYATDGTWQHACAVFTADDDRKIYRDGGNVGSNTTSRTPTTGDLTKVHIGGLWAGGAYRDSLAEVAIWNVALTVTEIGLLSAGYSPLFVRPQNLDLYVPLIRDASVEDLVGGRSFSLIGTDNHAVVAHPPVIYPGVLSRPAIAGAGAASPYGPILQVI